MSRPTTTGRSTVPVAFSLNPRDRDILEELAHGTGLTKSEILRRLLYAYHSGYNIPGLPRFQGDDQYSATPEG